jgi:multisubunit Na+/H+ antiporter MnhB subunit
MAALIGLSALAVTLIGRPGDALTAAITTAVVMGVAALSPHAAWRQPILRFADTVIGVAVGVGTAWLTLRMPRHEKRPITRTPLIRKH